MKKLEGVAWLNSPNKRAEDILLVAGVIPVAGPPAIAGASAVTALDRVNPFFKQERIGRNGNPITIYKIRTMPGVKEHSSSRGDPNDDRASKVGKVLRKLRVDEFPQVANVIQGNMSVVGPRALLAHDYDLAREVLDPRTYTEWLKTRTRAKPGIFDKYGMLYHNGQVQKDPAAEYSTRVECDTQMIEEASFTNDMQIMGGVIKMFFAALRRIK